MRQIAARARSCTYDNIEEIVATAATMDGTNRSKAARTAPGAEPPVPAQRADPRLSNRPSVDRYLRMDWSPEQVSGFLRAEGIMRISHEAIYIHVWHDKAHGRDLWRHLRQATKVQALPQL